MSNILESRVVRTILWTLGGLIVLLLAFGFGVSVGERRAGFDAGFSKNYYRDFYGGAAAGPAGPVVIMRMPIPITIHGVVGTVIDVGTSTVSITDPQGNEQSVAVASGTDIRENDAAAGIGEIMVGDSIAVIGAPNSQGQIVARFIRIFPVPSSTAPEQSSSIQL